MQEMPQKAVEKNNLHGTANFVIKVVTLSALLSLSIKYGGPLLPLQAPFTEELNSLVMTIVVMPSLIVGLSMGAAMLIKTKP